MAETDDVGKEQKLESARRFCDLMEEEEDISIAQVNYIYKRHKFLRQFSLDFFRGGITSMITAKLKWPPKGFKTRR